MADSVPRPRHTTFAAWLIIGCSGAAVIGVAEQLAGLNTLETRQALQDFLRRPPGSDLGLDLSSARTLLRVLLMVVAGCATAACVLGFGILRRDRRARLALTVLAVPLFLGGLFSGGFLTSIAAVSCLYLWIGPSADWLTGRTPPSAPDRAAARRPDRESPPREVPPGEAPPASSQPATQSAPQGQPAPSGQPTPQAWAPPPEPWRSPQATPAWGAARPAYSQSSSRPTALVWACSLAWSISGLAITLFVFTGGVLLSAPDTIWHELERQRPELERQGFSRADLTHATLAIAAVAIVWCLVAVVLAILAFRGSNSARIALSVSGYVAAAVCLLAAITAPLLVVPLVGCAVGASLLLRPEVRRWCAAQGPRRRPRATGS